MNQAPLFFLIAGEPSGDLIGARLMAALRALTKNSIRFAGVGGQEMEREGLKSLFPMEELSIMGVFEIFPHLTRLFRRIRETSQTINYLQPTVVITIDAPAFAHSVATRIKNRTILRIHYVAPTVWAWRPWRVKKFQRHFHHLLALLPFEPKLFLKSGLPCTFVGHPIIESGADKGDGKLFRSNHSISPSTPILCVLVGSRKGEIDQLADIFGKTVGLLTEYYPNLLVVLPTISTLSSVVQKKTSKWIIPTIIVENTSEKYDAMAACNAALTASGTASLELAMAKVPSIVAYRLPWLTYIIVRVMTRIKFATLTNIIMDQEIVPEFLQQNCSPEKLGAALLQILSNGNETQITGSVKALKHIGQGGEKPSFRAAQVLLDIVSKQANKPIL